MALMTENPTVDLLEAYLRPLGYRTEKLTLDNSDFTRFIAPGGGVWLTQDAHIAYPFMSATPKKISARKDLAYEFCQQLGVKVPWTQVVTEAVVSDELAALVQNEPVVVKPRSASLSRGVTLNVLTPNALKAAISAALEFSDAALVQQQITGEEVRLVVVEGKVRAALLRQTARVVGNGTDTVRALLAAENQARQKLRFQYVNYPQLDETILDLSGVDLDKIPEAGEMVELGRGTMIKTGASVYNVLHDIHPSYVRTAEKLATALGARFIVVDIMMNDYRRAQSADNYAFIEFNTSPVLKLFYSCRDGEQYDVLQQLGPMIDASLQGVAV